MKSFLGSRATGCLGWTAALGMTASIAGAASDARFFGTYCGTHREAVTVWVPLFPLLPVPVERTFEVVFSVSAHADYHESHLGNGLVHGGGTIRVQRSTLPEWAADDLGVRAGDEGGFAFHGRVTGRGRATGTAIAPGRDATGGTVTLSEDGMEIRLAALDREVTLSKTACGNSAPTVGIRSPEESSFRWGESVGFHGTIDDDADNAASIPDRHKVWTSDRDGVIGQGHSIWTRRLSAGRHRVTFTVTDNGGLTRSASKRITIENTAPRVFIDDPTAGSGTHYAGSPITFRGHANDSEQGNLVGSALTWTRGLTAMGSGNELQQALAAGAHTIKLTATDGDATAFAETRITVHACPGDNCPPGVTILSPPHLSAPVSDVAALNCLTLVAEASDKEDGRLRGNALAWRTQRDGDPAPDALTERGESVSKCFDVGDDNWHTITVTATDSRGATRSDSIRIYVIGGGLY